MTMQAQAQVAAQHGSGDQLEQVTVTARRSSEKIQSTPVSITAFSPKALRQKNIQKTADLMFSTPGVYLSGSGGRENSVFQIRGQSKALSGTNSPAVASYFADVPQPVFGSGIDIYDMSSVQVLKGPQGTLFGRNTTGGAVLFYPVLPTYTPNGYLQVGYGNYNTRTVEGAATIPLIPDIASVRVSGQYNQNDGYTKNTGVGGTLDNTDIKAFRASLLLDPTSWLKNVTTLDVYTNYYNGDAVQLLDLDPGFSLIDEFGVRDSLQQILNQEHQQGPFVTDSDTLPARNDSRRIGVTNRTDFQLPYGMSLTNIFGYRRTYLAYNINTDGTPAPFSTLFGAPISLLNAGAINHVEQFTDEVQLRGKVLNDKVSWLAGIFYLSSDPYGVTGTGLGLGQVETNPLDPPNPLAAFSYNNNYETSRAAFANVNWDMSDFVEGLHFDVGGRYTYDHTSACTANDDVTNGQIGPAACLNNSNPNLLGAATNSDVSHAPTWTVGFDYRINKSLFAYLVSRRGYREGGINSPTLGGTLTPLQTFGPEKVTDVELGVRSDYTFGDVRTRLNVSLFDGYYSGVQVPLSGLLTQPGCIAGNPVYGKPPYSPDGDCNSNNDPNSGTLLINAGKSRVDGIDFDGDISPIHNLVLSFGGNILDPETTSFAAPPEVDFYEHGKSITFNMVAKATLNGAFTYTLPMGTPGDLVASGNIYYSSRLQFTDTYLEPYSVTNFHLDWNHIYTKPVTLSFYINNAFDRKYAAIGAVSGTSLGFNSAIYGPPTMYGFTLRYDFGQ
jgi:iron complex outermembrane receptor protein